MQTFDRMFRDRAALQSILAVGYGKARRPEFESAAQDAIKAWQHIVTQNPDDVDARNALACETSC